MIALSNIVQGSAVLAVWWMTCDDEKETQITLPSAVSAYLGVTEPAMFGVKLKYIYPFIAGMIGSAIAGFISTTFKVTANSIEVGGLPGFLVIQIQSMIPFIVAMIVALAVPFILTLFFKRSNILTNNQLDFDIPFFKQ